MQVHSEVEDRSLVQPSTEFETPEAELLDAISRGDREAFTQVVVQYSSTVYNYLRARLVTSADADDISQEVFLRIYQHRDKFRRAQTARGWLLGYTRNVFREYLRKKIRRNEIWTRICLELTQAVNQNEMASTSHESDILTNLPGCIARLDPNARRLIELRYRDDLSMSEIGELTGCSKGAARVALHRARQTIKKYLVTKLYGSNCDRQPLKPIPESV